MEEFEKETRLQEEEASPAIVTSEEKEINAEEQAEAERVAKKLYRRGFRNGVLVAILLVVLLFSGSVAAMLYTGMLNLVPRQVTSSAAGSTGNAGELTEEQLKKAESLYAMLQKYYNGELDSDTMAEGIYHGILEGAGDTYTQYFSASELTSFNNYTDNAYFGIGVGFLVQEDGSSIITKIYEGAFAEAAGLEVNDIILAVDGIDISGWEASAVKEAIQGEAGTFTVLRIQRGDEVFEVEVERGEVVLPTVGYTVIDEIGYIQVAKFGEKTATEFSDAVAAMKEEAVKAVIIDLRDNTGGRVDTVVSMMDEVLGEGVTLTMENTDAEDKVYSSDAEKCLDLPIVTLVNEKSASSSEIFAAAMKDYKVGALVGATTFGKGVYQNIFNLQDGSAVKITTGKFYSPLGYNYNGEGITPDYEVEYEYISDAEVVFGYEQDSQLTKAFEVARELAE